MKFGKTEACFLPVMAVTFFFLALPIPEKPLSLPIVGKPPGCIGPSNATAVGFVLKFFIPETATVLGIDGSDASIYDIKAPDGTSTLTVGYGLLWNCAF